MNSKKLVLEEYNSNFNYKINQTNISISFNRVAFIYFVSVFIFLTFTLKIIFLTGKDLPNKKIFLNTDQRGYALKISDEIVKGHEFARDWETSGLLRLI